MEKEKNYFHINETIFNEIWPIDVGYQAKLKNKENLKSIKNNYPYFLMHYIVSGKCFVTIDGVTREFSSGDIFIIFPHTDVEYKSDKEDIWEYYWINFNGTRAINTLKEIGINKEKYYSTTPIKEAEQYFINAYGYKEKPRSQPYGVSAQIMSIFALLMENNEDLSTARTDDYYVTDYIINYVKDNLYSHTLSATGVSKHFHLNPKYFSTLFNKKFNISFKEFVNYERIKKASELMETTNFSVKYIAETIGFNDCLYFSKVFKKYRLMAPTEYIKKNRKQKAQ